MNGSPQAVGGEAGHVCCVMVNKRAEPHVDTLIAETAERQHGLITLLQLLALGLSRSAVSRRTRAGRLHRIHRGVYAVGRPSLTQRGRWMAAVLTFGPVARLSHRSVAALHGLRPDNRAKIDVTLPRSSVRSRHGIEVHGSSTLTAADVTAVDGIPCTTVARTLVDLGDDVDGQSVEHAVGQAEVLGLFDGKAVDAALERAGPLAGRGSSGRS
jgi:predicted transcriptional regulator of viral defense system